MWILVANLAVWAVSTRDQGRIVAWAAVGACAGVYLFFRGFKMLQFKRLILNTPASKVRSASMGLVELNGTAVGPNTIPAGITGDPCYYYRATAWEYQRSGNRSEWKRVAEESLFVPFFLQDETGRMLVNAQGADMDVHCNFKDEFGGSFFSSGDMPMGSVEDFLLRYGISGRRVRLEERCIKPEYSLFVLGTLGENTARWGNAPERHVSASSSSISLRLSTRSTGNSLMWMFGGSTGVHVNTRVTVAKFPSPTAPPATSSWNAISMDEVHPPSKLVPAAATVPVPVPTMASLLPSARDPLPSEIRSTGNVSLPDMPPLERTATDGFDLNATVAIGKGDSSAPFTISCESQRELANSLGWKSAACIWGGPALTVTCIYILLLTLGLM